MYTIRVPQSLKARLYTYRIIVTFGAGKVNKMSLYKLCIGKRNKNCYKVFSRNNFQKVSPVFSEYLEWFMNQLKFLANQSEIYSNRT